MTKTAVRNRNESRDYELSPMRYVVVQPINGKSDWYTVAAFSSNDDARRWAKDNTVADDPARNLYPLEVREVGQEYTS